jgi:dihydrodiol dehydrogenase / D-xylose 1-dehydrogenase (NADP)
VSTILYQWHGNLFCMEGMWTRFFPAVEKARSLALGSSGGSNKGVIGEVVQVHSYFNFNASDSEHYPSSFVYNHDLGGGASMLVAPYPIAAATLFFNGVKPDSIKAVGRLSQVDVAKSLVKKTQDKMKLGRKMLVMNPQDR